MSEKAFFDSNVLLYGLDKSSKSKKQKVFRLLRDNEPVISPQVVFECLNVSIKKLKKSKKEAFEFLNRIIFFTEITIEDSDTVSKALTLYSKHSLQIFDSKIIATALLAECSVLYSEDLQHGQVFEKKLKVVNPFLKD